MDAPAAIPDFDQIYHRAQERKGGLDCLNALLPEPRSSKTLRGLAEDRILSAMTQCVNQAGFHWRVIEKKMPEFEEAFFGFKVDTLLMLSDEQWEAYLNDRRVVRNWPRIKALKDNARFIYEQRDHGGIASTIADWPYSDQIGLLKFMKQHGSRLGGMTGQWLLRKLGKDGFVLTRDVVTALQGADLDVKAQPSSQKEFKLIQQTFNQWHESTDLPYTHLSKIAAYSCGDNQVGVTH